MRRIGLLRCLLLADSGHSYNTVRNIYMGLIKRCLLALTRKLPQPCRYKNFVIFMIELKTCQVGHLATKDNSRNFKPWIIQLGVECMLLLNVCTAFAVS